MTSRLADRLNAARRRRFVGRDGERSLFAAALAAGAWPFSLLYVFGPGGVGKTTLLYQFLATCDEAGVPGLYLDARNVEPSPDSFVAALQRLLGLDPAEAPAQALAARPARRVLCLDTYETLAPLDDWLRETFLPQLPEDLLIVLAGRRPAAPAWRADPGWQALVRVLPLRNLGIDPVSRTLEDWARPKEVSRCHGPTRPTRRSSARRRCASRGAARSPSRRSPATSASRPRRCGTGCARRKPMRAGGSPAT